MAKTRNLLVYLEGRPIVEAEDRNTCQSIEKRGTSYRQVQERLEGIYIKSQVQPNARGARIFLSIIGISI